MVFFARQDQPLAQHIENTANIARRFADVFGCGNAAYCAGLLHDLGKYTGAYQDYLGRSLRGEDAKRGEVIHALQGAKFVLDSKADPMLVDIIGNVVAAHHSGLFDIITEGERTLHQKLSRNENGLHYEEAIGAFRHDIDVNTVTADILTICKICCSKKLASYFTLHLMTKALYSCLVDADRCDAAGFSLNDDVPSWNPLIRRLETHLAGFAGTTKLDAVRKQISEQCKQSGCRPQGIYTLSVPTGGGKTLSSLRFALEHAKAHGLKRIIYIIPYLSILDQTAKITRDVFGDENGEFILEHHSDVEPSESHEESEHLKLLTSRWDSPIILTTMVQFLETVYSNRASKLRKFHNMSEAVLVFDEIQALPIKCVHLFNAAVNFLNVFGKSTVLLCTATQPHLNKVERPVMLSDNPALVTLSPSDQKVFERVRLVDRSQSPMSHMQIAELAKAQLADGKSTLIILNTKGDARSVYEYCKALEIGEERAFLTTDLCPAHRMVVLGKLHVALKAKRPTLCVSTQLIEAGVNISFGCVIRAMAGLDSIIQAAGRCNRNNEHPDEPQAVFVIDVQDENLSRLPEIEEGKRQTTRVIREGKNENLLGDEAMNLYYKYYFFDQRNMMDYVVKRGRNRVPESTVYSLLNDNPLGLSAFRDCTGKVFRGLPAAFKTGAEVFSVIDGRQTGIIVPYGGAIELIIAFQGAFDPKEKVHILKCLQKYAVNVYSYTLSALADAGALRSIDDAFYLLSSNWYDSEEQGLLAESRLTPLNA